MSLVFLTCKLASARLLNPLNVAVSVVAMASLMAAPLLFADHHGSYDHHDSHTQQDSRTQHGSHGHHGAPAQAQEENPAVTAYQTASDRMHEDMAMSFTGNPDIDFAKGMIPHHEGAIAMAEIVLEYGEDSEIRQLAEDIVAAQESEIAFLREWLERHGH